MCCTLHTGHRECVVSRCAHAGLRFSLSVILPSLSTTAITMYDVAVRFVNTTFFSNTVAGCYLTVYWAFDSANPALMFPMQFEHLKRPNTQTDVIIWCTVCQDDLKIKED